MRDGAATDARETLKQLTSAIERHLGSDLLGLYLFGSLAVGAFYPGKSDLDLMAIVAAEVEEGEQLESLRSLHDTFVTERSVDTLIKRLRRKIEDEATDPTMTLTVWGTGYKFADN